MLHSAFTEIKLQGFVALNVSVKSVQEIELKNKIDRRIFAGKLLHRIFIFLP